MLEIGDNEKNLHQVYKQNVNGNVTDDLILMLIKNMFVVHVLGKLIQFKNKLTILRGYIRKSGILHPCTWPPSKSKSNLND